MVVFGFEPGTGHCPELAYKVVCLSVQFSLSTIHCTVYCCLVLVPCFFLQQRRYLLAFKDINAIMCEPDLMTRGRLVIELKTNAVSVCT